MAKDSKRGFGLAGLLVGFLFLGGGVHAANVLVPTLDLITRAYMDAGVLVLATHGDMNIAFDGGYKFGGSVAFEYSDGFLEQPSPETGLTFKKAAVTVRQLFSLPIAFSWFIGENDLLCEGDAFGAVFGTLPIMTRYRGFMYFPGSVIYDGIHGIDGTGFRIDVSPIPESLLFSLYGYEDTNFIVDVVQPDESIRQELVPGRYSGDFRVLADFGSLKAEGFLGATYVSASLYGYYRGGVLFYASGGESVEFLAQIGVPLYDPGEDPTFSIDLFYILFEPRLHIGIFSITPTFFWHPSYYLQRPTEETGSFDVNLDLSLGDISDFGLRGGLESNFRFISGSNSFNVVESPYISIAAMGMLWDLKLDVHLEWPLTLDSLSGMIGIKAEF